MFKHTDIIFEVERVLKICKDPILLQKHLSIIKKRRDNINHALRTDRSTPEIKYCLLKSLLKSLTEIRFAIIQASR